MTSPAHIEPTAARSNERGAPRARALWRYHFSVDDVFDALIDVSDRRLRLFTHPFFSFLKRLHDEFGTRVDLYLFYRKRVNGRWRTLDDVSESISGALRENRWLQLGPHALDYDTPPYRQTPDEQMRAFDSIYMQLDRFAPGSGRSKWIRLHYFSEAYEIGSYFKTRGVEALLTTDRSAVSYRLPDPARERLKERGRVEYEGVTLVRTHIRMEGLVASGLRAVAVRRAVDSVPENHGVAVLMTHESELARSEVRKTTVAALRHLAELGATSL